MNDLTTYLLKFIEIAHHADVAEIDITINQIKGMIGQQYYHGLGDDLLLQATKFLENCKTPTAISLQKLTIAGERYVRHCQFIKRNEDFWSKERQAIEHEHRRNLASELTQEELLLANQLLRKV